MTVNAAELASVAVELLASTDPRDIRARLVRLALEETGADRCTLTSVDRGVFRVEESYEPGDQPTFVGQEYPLSHLEHQPLVARALASGQVTTGESLVSGGTPAELVPALQDVRHSAIVPLRLGPEVGAMFVLSRKRDEPFEAAALQRVAAIGGVAVLSLHNARMLEGVTSAQRRGLDALALFSEHLAASESRSVFFGRMSETVAGLTGAQRVAYWFVDGDELRVQPHAYGFGDGDSAAMTTTVPAALNAGLFGVLYAGESLRFRVQAGGRANPIAPAPITNLLAVPWRTAEGSMGILVAYDSADGFAEQDEWILRLSARASALVLQGYTAQQRMLELQAQELERLREHGERMAAVERRKSDFLKLASHELRGPLTLLRGYVSILQEGTIEPLPPKLAPALQRMDAEVSRMNELVSQMLAAIRLEAGQLRVVTHESRIDEMVRKVVAATDTAGHRVVIDAPAPAVAFADRGQVETIIANLLSNAVKYSPEGGDITVAVRADEATVAVDVGDQGIGIAPDELDDLFRPFSRLPAAEERGIDGVGLGLYLSRELARAQDGDITVSSEPACGSVFTLRLPRRRPAPSPAGAHEG